MKFIAILLLVLGIIQFIAFAYGVGVRRSNSDWLACVSVSKTAVETVLCKYRGEK